MNKFSSIIVKNRKWLMIIFCIIIVASIVSIFFVKINYDDTKYLPENSNFTIGLNVMKAEFGANGNATVMFKNKDIKSSITMKEKIAEISGVKSIIWIDDLIDNFISAPLTKMQENGEEISKTELTEIVIRTITLLPDNLSKENMLSLTGILLNNFSDEETSILLSFFDYTDINFDIDNPDFSMLNQFKEQLSSFYTGGSALYQITFNEDNYSKNTLSALQTIVNIDPDIYITGNSAMTYLGQKTLLSEVLFSSILVIISSLIIMFLISSSFFEPLLYVLIVGISIIINMGTNIIFTNGISYITNSVACILQLALSIDYSIFLLQRYKKERKEGKDVNQSMKDALRHSLSPISASSLTTIASFVALMFMKYKMGLDMSLVMGKGIIISLLTAFLFMPGLIISANKLLEKSEHKTLNLSFTKFSKVLYKLRFIIPIIAVCVIVPSIYFESKNTFTYGSENAQGGEGSEYGVSTAEIENVFGIQNQMAIILPKSYGEDKELEVSYALLNLQADGVKDVQSISLINNSGFAEMFPEKLKGQFVSENYTRILVSLSGREESEQTKALIQKIKDVLNEQLGTSGDSYYILGASVATYEIMNLTQSDFKLISLIAMLLVGVVLLFTYKSLILPILLLLCIQSSIWLNMAIPYFSGEPIVFIGYMIICNILLGATIDYAILMTTHYMESRKLYGREQSMKMALAQSSRSLILSAGIFTAGGLIIGISLSMPTTRMFGYAIMRGGICALLMVIFVLPVLLVIFDKLIRLLTYKGKQIMIREIPIEKESKVKEYKVKEHKIKEPKKNLNKKTSAV